MSNSRDFSDKVVIVTGASGGIGSAVAKKYAQFGAKVVATGRNADRLKEVAKACKCLSSKGYDALIVPADLTNAEDCKRLVASTIEKFGKLDVIVANAGVFASALIDNPKLLDIFDNTMLTNVRPVLRLLQIAAPYLEKTKGSVVITSSMLSFRPIAIYMPYCMSKAALDIMAKCLALDLGPKGIRVNTVNPAIVADEFVAKSLGLDPSKMGEELHKAGQTYPLRRLATVEDIANAILYLSSNDASFVTGQNLVLDGGSTWGGNSEVN